ncbi:MAG: sodium-dependent bicarbonate transport family permease [Bacteroidia bacterium]|nr:sodium-dependent bicarbonate transport family permease [Bacteroidia bacterium]
MNILLENITNPALLFFALGILSVYLKSDLKVPPNSSKFISLYLMFAIGFKGGQELAHEEINAEIVITILLAIVMSLIIPVYTFYILKQKFNVFDAGAIACSYGSVSAVTFVTAVTYLEAHQYLFHGHMVAIMALMESPPIMMGLLLIHLHQKHDMFSNASKGKLLVHSFTNASVFLILGSMLIGYIADTKQAEGIKPFTNDLFKGFLAIFLLDMGITSGKNLKTFFSYGWFPVAFAVLVPLLNGFLGAMSIAAVTSDISNRFLFSVLCASASYIAVPAAIRMSIPQANAGLVLPMALAFTFPVNITLGMPVYLKFAELF